MDIFLIALVTAAALIVVPLTVVAAGIHRQDRAPSLSDPVPGLAAALTRRLLALHADPEPAPAPVARPAHHATPPARTARPAVTTRAARS
jgi:hypothetical protein